MGTSEALLHGRHTADMLSLSPLQESDGQEEPGSRGRTQSAGMASVPSSARTTPEGWRALALALVARRPRPTPILYTSVVSWGRPVLKLPHHSSWRQRPWPPVLPADPSRVHVNMGRTQPADSPSGV